MNYGPKVFTLSMDHYQEKFKQSIKGNVLVCIDAANLERSVKTMWVNPKDIPDEFKRYQSGELCYRVDYQKVKDFFQSSGHVAKELPPACNQYFDIVDFRNVLLRIDRKAKNPA